MILSQTSVYALKAVMHLAEAAPDGPVRVEDIAAALDVPRNYLSKILAGLARAGVVSSTRGPGGGFTLALDPSGLALAQVIDPFDDIAQEARCFLGRERCSDDRPCAAHAHWRAVAASVTDFLRGTTIDDLTVSGTPKESPR